MTVDAVHVREMALRLKWRVWIEPPVPGVRRTYTLVMRKDRVVPTAVHAYMLDEAMAAARVVHKLSNPR